jgi:predicted MFS family arabinose efflux permease
MAALRFRAAERPPAPQPVDWAEALDFCDRSQLTLVVGEAAKEALPGWARERIARNLADNSERLQRVRGLESQVREWLEAAGIPFVVLKGTTQWPHFVADLRRRPQCDLDLFCPAADAQRAWALLREKGYQPLEEAGEHPTDHLPALIPKTGWEWRGNEYDPDLPLAIEVHFQFWDEYTERVRVPGSGEFWQRRQGLALDTADALAYAGLHLLRHLLRGSARACHVYELAWFLEQHAGDDAFWRRWQALHPAGLRALEAIAFRLAREWFGCAPGPVAEQEIAGMAAPLQDWFDAFAFSPLEGFFHPNKDELWLHLALLHSARDKLAVVRRRLLPLQLPGPVDAACLPEEQLTVGRRMLRNARYCKYVAGRVAHHLRAVPSVVRSGLRWRRRAGGLSRGYWLFLGASLLFVLGMFIYVQLYNLYLLDLGFREDVVGKVSSFSTAGTALGILPAAALARRWGLSKVLLVFFGGLAAVSAVRLALTSVPPILALAFLYGVVFALYAVSLAPAIAQLTSDKARATGFSISTASSIALGIPAGWLMGWLPGRLGGKRPAMLAGCLLVALALWPASRLKIAPAPAEGARLYPRSRFVARFLVVFAIWNLATGAFNPFFATFFAHLHMPVQRIGHILAGGQLAQVAALMLAPLVLRRLGMVTGTAAMLMATALAMGALAAGPTGMAAAVIFAGYTAFQWMTEPGINTLLMDRVQVAERSGAAALMMLVSFAGQFAASWLGGDGIARFGYSVVLACAAAVAAIAAAGFRSLAGTGGPAGTAAAEAPEALAAPAVDQGSE